MGFGSCKRARMLMCSGSAGVESWLLHRLPLAARGLARAGRRRCSGRCLSLLRWRLDEACFACHSTPQALQQQPASCHLLPLHPRRFYGGIKLGAGGLVRAYGGAARDCLRAAPKRQMTPQVQLQLQVGTADVAKVAACSLALACTSGAGHACSWAAGAAHMNAPPHPPHLPLINPCNLQVPFELLGPVYPLLEQHGAQKQEESYDDAAGVRLVVRLEAGQAQALSAALADATSGRVQAETIG